MPDEGPEYGWLYGGKKDPNAGPPPDDATRPIRRPSAAAPAEDATRMMPAQPRPSQAGTQTTRPTPPRPAPAVPPPASERPRRRRFRLRYVFLLLLAWLVFIVAVPIVSWNSVEKVEFDPGGDRPGDQPGTTYLLVGSDSRAGLSKEERKELNTGNAGGGRTDSIMLLHTGSGPNTLVSIPRDAEVPIPGHGTSKINAAYVFGGAPLLVQTIENLSGVRIDHYVEIGMGGVVGVVDAVGGIEICPERKMVDKDAGLNIKKGCQDVDGKTALAYSRSRHAQQLGDLDRIKHQREVVAAVGDKVLSPWTVVNPVRWWQLNHSVPDFFAFGEDMGPMRAGMWALALTSVDKTCTIPVTGGSAQLDEERARVMFEAMIKDDTDAITTQLCTGSGIAK